MTAALAHLKTVTVIEHGKDLYGRTIAEVMLPDGHQLNSKLVREGLCWWYRKYAPANDALQRLEAEARDGKRGLWADQNPMPPWEFRKQGKRERRKDAG